MAGTQRELTNQMLAVAVAACEDKKAEDIRILALDPAESGLADYFLICTGQSDRQNVAITDEIEIQLKRQFGAYPQSVEGRRQGEWILMDYVDFIVHVFSVEKRAYYGLERLRKSATTLSVADLNNEIKNQIANRRKQPAAKRPAAAAAKSVPRKPAKKVAKKVVKAVAKKVAKKPAKRAAPKKATRKAVKGKKRS
jgi:ribosome-associated protein